MSNQNDWEYLFTWRIIDFNFCNKKTGEELKGPTFLVEAMKNTKWYTSIYLDGIDKNSEDYISCFINRNKDDEHEQEIEIDYEIQIMLDGKTLETRKASKSSIKNGEGYGFRKFYERQKLLSEVKNCNSNTLTFLCYLKSQNVIKRPFEKNEGRTLILTDKSCFVWNVKISSENIRYFCLRNIFYKITITIPQDDVKIAIQRISGGSSTSAHITAKISLLDGLANESLTTQDKHSFCSSNQSETWEFPSFLNKKLLPDNSKAESIILSCKFFISMTSESNTVTNFHSVELSDTEGYSNLSVDFRNMFTNKIRFDVKLRVGDGVEFEAHKCVLAARSPVFCAMFDQQMLENRTGVVNIEDIDENTLESFLKFIYTGTVDDMNGKNASKLLMVADKYEVPFLKQKCAFYLMSALSVDNVCEIISLADMVHTDDLKMHAFDFAIRHKVEVFSSPELSSWISAHPILSAEMMAYWAKV